MATVQDVLKLVKDNDVKYIDFRFTDTRGKEHHVGVPVSQFDADKFEETLALVDSTSPYALTGSILAQDRDAVVLATKKLRNAAGNFYINDKPTGAVVGQQPFGGARASGTNDKAGSMINLYRWLSARTIKETFNPPTDYQYPFLQES